MSIDDDTLSPGSARALAAAALLLGGACAVVNAWLFSLGLERLEPDAQARLPLQLAGWLMVAAEHLGLGLAALLPTHLAPLKRRLTTLAVLLAAFEVLSLYTAQAALEHSHVATSTAHDTRAADLRAAIDSRRATVAQLRANGSQQTGSSNGWRQHLGANALRDALAAEQQINTLEAQLAALHASSRPTASGVLGAHGAVLMAAARSALIAGMGLVLLGAAGQLWACARRTRHGDQARQPQPALPSAVPQPTRPSPQWPPYRPAPTPDTPDRPGATYRHAPSHPQDSPQPPDNHASAVERRPWIPWHWRGSPRQAGDTPHSQRPPKKPPPPH
jgi:hypothetical protein